MKKEKKLRKRSLENELQKKKKLLKKSNKQKNNVKQ